MRFGRRGQAFDERTRRRAQARKEIGRIDRGQRRNAGGDGNRLKSLTRQIAGDERPKQFCSVLGKGTLLEETQRRLALKHQRYASSRVD